jgi:hypothetical protein
MGKRFFFFILASGTFLPAATAEYFPVQTGNVWTFSYASTSAPVVPNPPTTRDSGTVKWEIVSNIQTEESLVIGVKQTRDLVRRTLTQPGASGYDSVFTSPRTKIDTIFLMEHLSPSNGICFPGDTCSFAVHDPTVAMPAELSSKDTTVLFQGSSIAGKKMIVSECSCLHKWYSYSFTLGSAVGPVETYITPCPGLAGVSYKETWKLISREYPTAVSQGNARPDALKTVVANQSSGRISCRLNLDHSSPVRIEIVDLKGCLLRIMLQAHLSAGTYHYSWDFPANAPAIALLRVWTGVEERCVRIMTEVK